jgi:dolichyl-phosphate beta-glucosyltransferase
VPFPRPDKTVALSWQTAARYSYATPGGYFIAPGADGHAYIGGPAGTTQQLLATLEDKGERPAVTPELRTSVLNEMTAWGIDLAILGPDPRQGELRQLMSEVFQREPQEVGGVLVWERPAG